MFLIYYYYYYYYITLVLEAATHPIEAYGTRHLSFTLVLSGPRESFHSICCCLYSFQFGLQFSFVNIKTQNV